MSGRRRHRLALTRLQASKIALFVGLYSLVISIPALLFTAGSNWLRAQFPAFWWTLPITFFGLLALGAPIVYFSLVRQMEARLLWSQRRYHRTLVSASSGMTRIKEIQRLCRLITYMVNRTVELTNTILFLYDPKERRYFLRAVRYPSQIPSTLSVEPQDPMITLLQAKKDLIVLEELDTEEGHTTADAERARQAQQIAAWMRQFEARLIVPSFSSDRLLGFLVLGAKRSEGSYTTDDIAIFSGLANQAALAIENAMYFEELRTNEAYMIQSEKLASIGQLASGMAHEIHNPLTVISGEAQLYLERFRDRDPKVDELLMSIVEECKRAADITRRILRFAKPAQADVSPVDLKATIEESLTLAGYQVRLDRVERTVQLPDDLPQVRSNQNQLQEVLLNLILNAYQAMGEQGGQLTLSASRNGSQVILKVADTGPGIPATTLRKVFDPFYTTKASGTGLGLFVTQRILQSHGGSIELESTEGQGTCFTIRLPIWTDSPDAAPAAVDRIR